MNLTVKSVSPCAGCRDIIEVDAENELGSPWIYTVHFARHGRAAYAYRHTPTQQFIAAAAIPDAVLHAAEQEARRLVPA